METPLTADSVSTGASNGSAPFDPAAWPRLLNLGCGWDKRDGHLNIDLHAYHEPDMVADVRCLPMLPDAYYDGAVAQDVLEHLTRGDGPIALREWARVVRVGGFLELRVPNLLGLAVLLSSRTAIPQQKELIQCLFGTQAYNGDFHQNGYTEVLLRHELWEAGFGEAEFRTRDEWLFDVTAIRTPAGAEMKPADHTFMHLGLPSIGASAPATADHAPTVSGREDLTEWARVGKQLGRRAVQKAVRDLRSRFSSR